MLEWAGLLSPFVTLLLVWEYGLHWAFLISLICYGAGLLFAIGIVIGEKNAE